jgi:phenylacetate-CoA ligase
MIFLRRPDRARLDAFRDRRLRSLVRHAYHRVAYYREAMRAHGVTPEDIRGVADIRRLPLLDKGVVQDRPMDLIAEGVDPDRLKTIWSAGSTGRRVQIYHSADEKLLLAAVMAKGLAEVGRTPRMRQFGTKLIRGPRAVDWRLRLARAAGFFRSTAVDVRDPPAEIVEAIRRARPDCVGGFPAVIARIAESAGPGGLTDVGVRIVTVGGAVLTQPMRATIHAAFGCPVRNTYNCVEFAHLARECPASGQMHVCDEGVVLEIVRGDRPAREGESGEVVATGLHQFAMPLIRYRLGDIAVRGADRCPCGSIYPTIDAVQGRMNDYFVLPNGRLLHPWTLSTPVLEAHRWIDRYRITQERRDLVIYQIMPRIQPTPEQVAAVEGHCRSVLGSDVTLTLRIVDRIEDDGEPKSRVSFSRVASDYEGLDWSRVQDAPSA